MLARTLMCRDRELLDFEVDPKTGVVGSVRVLDESCHMSGSAAPSFVGGGRVSGSLESDVQRLLQRRGLSPRRADLPEILRATGTESAVELALRSWGCSLSDQYWYRPQGSWLRWADVSFFDNSWDQSFGETVLSRDWNALARASVETPDVTCGGWTRKAWVLEGSRRRMLKATPSPSAAYLDGEVIVTRMLSRILGPEEFTHYEKVHRFDEDFVACDLMLGPAEEQVSASCLLGPAAGRYSGAASAQSMDAINSFARVAEGLGVSGATMIASKISVVATLALCGDRHFSNYGLIRNVETGAYRASPLYDYGGSFGLGLMPNEIDRLCDNPRILVLFVASLFSELDRGWDYSWYDSQALTGFDEELEEAVRAIDGLHPAYPRIVREAFSMQLDYVNEVARG